jgi:hypothetical protein
MKPISPADSNARFHPSPTAIVGTILAFGVVRMLAKVSTEASPISSRKEVLKDQSTSSQQQC